nr:5766_t:CDS:2 [Entrophospora candida]
MATPIFANAKQCSTSWRQALSVCNLLSAPQNGSKSFSNLH